MCVEADWTGPARVQLRALELDASLDDVAQLLQSFPTDGRLCRGVLPLNGTARMRDVKFQTEASAGRSDAGPIRGRTEELRDHLGSQQDLPLTLTSGDIGWQGSKLELRDREGIPGTIRNPERLGHRGLGQSAEVWSSAPTTRSSSAARSYPRGCPCSPGPGATCGRILQASQGNVAITGFAPLRPDRRPGTLAHSGRLRS
ncbi:MAG: hypothetical protein MZV70_60685 [Desulfobacterales bacterium]|nr:hypothetical protein [Desulfobacterales bacterium]